MRDLRVGLHLVVVEGPAVLPPDQIPGLVDARGWFPSDQVRLGLRYFFLPQVRRQLASEIEAQFVAFAATGLKLSHADAHKHMHLHPTVGRMLLRVGRAHGLRRIRVPAEPPEILARCGTAPTFGARVMRGWCGVLRRQAWAAGITTNDAVFGLAWTGHMTEERVLALLPHLPPGLNELYFHPACGRDAALDRLMPTYQHEAELAALVSPRVRAAMQAAAASSAASARTPTSPPAYSQD